MNIEIWQLVVFGVTCIGIGALLAWPRSRNSEEDSLRELIGQQRVEISEKQEEIDKLEQICRERFYKICDLETRLAEVTAPKIVTITKSSPAKEVKIPRGYNKWDGGENPAANKTVEVIFRNGDKSRDIASGWRWSKMSLPRDIIAYKVIAPKKKPVAKKKATVKKRVKK